MRKYKIAGLVGMLVMLGALGRLVGCGPQARPVAVDSQSAVQRVAQASAHRVDRSESQNQHAPGFDSRLVVVSSELPALQGGFVAPVELSVAASPALDVVDSSRATSHPHGEQVCASGCAASRHPTPPLRREHFRKLIADFGRQCANSESDSLDELVFFGPQSLRLLSKESSRLSKDHVARLEQELAIEDLVVQLRVIDERGVIRVALPPTRVPQHIRQEFAMTVKNFQPTITSGTIKRVGVKHAWQRL